LAASGDSIKVAPATYPENLTIVINLKILGSVAKTTIVDGGHVGRVVAIGNTVNVILSGLTLTNGYSSRAGAGIANSGTLALNATSVIGNLAAYYCGHNRNCGLAGGGIFNSGNLTIRNSTVSGNQVQLGDCDPGHCTVRGG